MLVSFVFDKDWLTHKAGEVVQANPEQVQALVDDGVLREATDEDVGGGGGGADPDDELTGDEKSLNAVMNKATERFEALLAKHAAERQTKSFTVPAQPKDNKHGFKTFGDYLRCLGVASRGDYGAMRKLEAFRSKTTYQSGATDAEGAFLIPQEWSDKIYEKAREGTNLVDMTTQYTSNSDTLNVPIVNDTSRVDGSRPLRYYLVSEANAFTASKIAFGNVALGLYKIGILAGATDELLADNAYNLEAQITKQFGDELRFALNHYIVRGSGSSQPTGILNATPLVTVSKEDSQAALTVDYANIRKMWARLYFESKPKAVWLVNHMVYGELLGLTFPNGSGTASAFGGLSFNAADEFPMRIFGRPVLELEACSALGAAGDIILADLSAMGSHSKPIEIAVSPHAAFTTGEILYRCFVRFDCKPLWGNVLTPYQGSATLAPLVIREAVGST